LVPHGRTITPPQIAGLLAPTVSPRTISGGLGWIREHGAHDAHDGNSIPGMGNVVAGLADRAVATRHETYAAEIRALLDAALAVMQRDDTIDPTVAHIVRESGLSNQTFYRHFDGKDALLLALLADGRERLARTIERRMERAHDLETRVRGWINAVLDQARDPQAAAATRPFVANSDRLAVAHPEEVARSRDQLLAPLAATVGDANAIAVYHLAMGVMHEALAARRAPSKREAESVIEFAIRGCTT
jgi:Bacterial regulatory proteins, tetR family.